MAEILRGEPVAEAIMRDLAGRAEALRQRGVTPGLAILRVGARPGDLTYERAAMRGCEKAGIRVERCCLPADCTQTDVMEAIARINEDRAIHGCLMFRPLPKTLDESAASEALLPEKDVDGMTAQALNTTFTQRGRGYAPCTSQAVIELLDHYGIDPAGKNITVIGRSFVIGRPVSMLLLTRNATVTICHSRTLDLPSACRNADILVVAAGKIGLVGPEFTNPGQIIVDVGVNATPDGRICGDVRFDEVAPCVRAISPVPSGVGSITTAVMCKHVIEAAEKAAR